MNGTTRPPSRVPAAVLVPAATVAAVGAQLLLLPWDPRSNVPVSPGSDTLTSGYTWWGTALFAVVLAAVAWAVGRWGRPEAAVVAIGGVPAVLLLGSFLAHEPDPDGFAGLWPTSWLVGAVLMVVGAGLVAGLAHGEAARVFRSLLVPVLVAAGAALSGFVLGSLASHAGWAARAVSAVLALAAGHGLGWAVRAAGRGTAASVALTAGGVLLIAAVNSASVPLWGWAAPDTAAWAVTVLAYAAGAASVPLWRVRVRV
ncbi:hypothetical protein OIB37_34720 [Streptomyces sp. NBC_00820]|uniref:hypothetical protein n=1 Tax=Streptomyces sp. NBC_00820 TaxID=2975842 RepID=UPI002ED23AD7|nr:hypothetical protein OIB37_34720 [Streptomyces sp. NBC_00820]